MTTCRDCEQGIGGYRTYVKPEVPRLIGLISNRESRAGEGVQPPVAGSITCRRLAGPGRMAPHQDRSLPDEMSHRRGTPTCHRTSHTHRQRAHTFQVALEQYSCTLMARASPITVGGCSPYWWDW